MFKDLDWNGALKRAAITVLIYLGLVYVLNVAFPDTSIGWQGTALNAAILFVIFTFFHAFVERRKKRARAAMQSQAKAKKDRRPAAAEGEDGEVPVSELRGQRNPNTSRKKASRRRR